MASYCLYILIRLSSLFVVLMPAAGRADARQFWYFLLFS